MLIGCKNADVRHPVPNGYRILNLDANEYSNKAQLEIKAVYTGNEPDKNEKIRILMELYNSAKNYKFKNYDAPTVINIKLYTSETKAIEDVSGFSAMLSKSPMDNEPVISYAIFNPTGNEDKEYKKQYDSTVEYYASKGANFCELYYQLNRISKEALSMFNDEYQKNPSTESALTVQEKQRAYINEKTHDMLSKYNIPDSSADELFLMGARFCK